MLYQVVVRPLKDTPSSILTWLLNARRRTSFVTFGRALAQEGARCKQREINPRKMHREPGIRQLSNCVVCGHRSERPEIRALSDLSTTRLERGDDRERTEGVQYQ